MRTKIHERSYKAIGSSSPSKQVSKHTVPAPPSLKNGKQKRRQGLPLPYTFAVLFKFSKVGVYGTL